MPALFRFLLVAWLLLGSAAGWAAAGLVLPADADRVEAWPALRVLPDPTQAMKLAEVRAQAATFRAPDVPTGNFGVRREAMWLHLPLQAAAAPGRWVLMIDYPPLNQIDVHLLRDGVPVAHHLLGSAVADADRPLKTAGHAVELDLPAGHQHELFLRVQTTSSMLVPIELLRPGPFVEHVAALQMLQGLMTGVAIALLVYSILNAFSVRDPLFLQYALMISGGTLFFIAYFGIGQQYLWHQQTGLVAKIAPLSILAMLVGANHFIAGALKTRQTHPRVDLGLRALAVVSGLALLLSVAGVLDYRMTQATASALGPMPLLLALPVAIVRMRSGDRVARLLVFGWGAYLIGALSILGLLRGLLPSNFWTQHLFQFSSMLEMALWVRVLGLRIEGLRRDAERSELEKHALRSLAHTDPLTSLPNRRGLNLALEGALAQCRLDSAVGVSVIDLDGFKAVNDRLGHDAGDELLVQVARRLRAQVRTSDVVARVGGDEFVVMSAGLANEEDALTVGRKLIEAFDEPFVIGGQECAVGLTIGAAFAPQDGRDAAQLLKRADASMYAGKQSGGHCLRRDPVWAVAPERARA